MMMHSFNCIFRAAVLLLVISIPSAYALMGGNPNGTADYALINGKIYTMNEKQPWADAVAIEGNKITYVGGASGLRDVIGLGTEVIDLDGRMVMPGFLDGHFHPLAGALFARGANLQTDDTDDMVNRIRSYVKDNPEAEVITGFGWRTGLYPDDFLTTKTLDAIESKRPVYMWAIDGHGAWVNSKALELAGVDKDTPDPVPGYSSFGRDAEGNPNGRLIEIPAQMQVFSAVLDADADYIRAGMEEWLPKFSAAGLTGGIDFGIMGIDMDDGFGIYKSLEREGKLPMRIVASYYWNKPEVDPIPQIKALKEKHTTELIKPKFIKINVDGGSEAAHSALFVDGYSDAPDLKVEPVIPADVLNDVVRRADAQGIDMVAHTIGDGAVRMLLDAYEGAIKANPPRDRRLASSHTSLVHPDDVSRFARLNVTADLGINWGVLDPYMTGVVVERIGKERTDRYLGAKELMDAGARVSFSSDWAASSYFSNHEPLVAIQMAVTRQGIGKPDMKPLGGDKAKVTLEQALRAHTLNVAYTMGMDDQIGSLEVGKLADLIVLDKNLFEVSADEIHKVKVMYTIMNGELVHDATTTGQ